MYIATRELPNTLRNALASTGYGKVDVEVVASTSYSLADAGGSGTRSFAAAVNLATGESGMTRGSWGGSNPFNPRNVVDNDDTPREIPENFAIIQGSEGGSRPVMARILVRPETLTGLLPVAGDELTEAEKKAITVICAYKSSHRAEYFARLVGGAYDISHPVLASLLSRKMIKVNAGGAISITTEGKNARDPSIRSW